MPITPYSGAFGRPELLHLLRRTLFGVTPADLNHFEGMTMQQVVTELMTFSTSTTPPLKNYYLTPGGNPDPSLIDPTVPFGSTWVNTPINPTVPNDPSSQRNYSYISWLTGNMVGQERNLREKMTLYWSNHVVTQIFSVFTPDSFYRYNQYLRDNCFGNFRQMMYDVTLHPSMLLYLNGFLNLADAPDENYAREVMELFTLGQGSGYTEGDVQQAAKLLTGWTVKYNIGGQPVLATTVYTTNDHDSSDKQFSSFFNNTVIQGQTGAAGGANEINAFLDMIFAKQEVSKFVCREIYRFFVHGEIDAATETNVIEPLAQLFRNNSGSPNQIGLVMQALLTSDHFYTADIRGCAMKSPVDLVVGALRTFGMPMPDASVMEAQYLIWNDIYWATEYCGQSLADPPNVAGWPAYYLYPAYDNTWMDTASFPNRRKTMLDLINNGLATPNNGLYDSASEDLEFRFDLVSFVMQFSDPYNPNVLISEAAELLFSVPISQAVRDSLKTNYLLFGQSSDHYWSDALELYVLDPNTNDPTAQLVPSILKSLFADMVGAAEYQLY